MAKIIPDYGSRLTQSVKSSGERRVYESLREGLTADFTVLHSVTWIARNTAEHAQDGEADFMLVHPVHGILVIEVKGGGISCDARTGEWFSTDSANRCHPIKNPFWQAKNAKHQILSALRQHRDWDRLVSGQICIGHAVWLPDIASPDQIVAPDRPRELILTHGDLLKPKGAIMQAWNFAGAQASTRIELGRNAVELVERLFARNFSVPPASAARIAEEEEKRIKLTETQFQVLKLLGPRRRVGISGGAGTGKTLLALEKAHDLSRRGFKTLLLTFNRPLGDHLATVVDKSLPITVSSFHLFCTRLLEQHPGDFLSRAQRNFPGKDHWSVILPGAVLYLLEDHEVKFDAILVDEAQDFADEYWFLLECMMADTERTPLYLFYDSNQRLYRKTASFPIKPDEEFQLTENCRNTQAIHQLVRPLFIGGELNPPAITGVPIEWHQAESLVEQIKATRALILKLTTQGGLGAEDIVVLVANRSSLASHLDALKRDPLPNGLRFEDSATSAAKRLRVMSAAKFKGLEASVVIIVGVDGLDPEKDEARMDLYVAFSRPKNELHVVGTSAALARLAKLQQFSAQ